MARTKQNARKGKAPGGKAAAKKAAAATAVKAPKPKHSPSRVAAVLKAAKKQAVVPPAIASPKKKNKKKKAKPVAVEILPVKADKKSKQAKQAKRKKDEKKKNQTQQTFNSSQQQQQVQLPPKRIGQGVIPWMKKNPPPSSCTPEVIDLTGGAEATVDKKRTTPSPQKKQRGVRLPTDDSDPILMERFSAELRAFGEYARLTPVECQARQALLQQMHQVATRVFQNDTEVDTNDLELQVFGSYACPEVCTFQSDVDCALWGAVYPKKTKQRTPAAKVSSSSSNNNNTQQQEAQQSQTTPVDPQLDRKQKWRLALAMMDEENGLTPDRGEFHAPPAAARETSRGETGDTKAVAKNGDVAKRNGSTNDSFQDEEEQDDMPLFVLDRTGVVDLTEDNSEPNDESGKTNDTSMESKQLTSVSTQATVTESESSVSETVLLEAKAGEGNDSSDDDTADKLTESRLRGTAMEAVTMPTDSRSEEPQIFAVASSGSESDNEEEMDEDEMAVHWFNQAAPSPSTEASDFSRRKVIDGLQRFFKGLRNSGMSRNIQLISRARVPIIKMESYLGVEVDCSIGGMNGADTTLYALKMAQKYQSFGPVVVALKVIMSQQNLDVPFNGGLGSYKLYVLVASHIAKHLELGGSDEPGEIFLSFLFRYGESVGHHHTHRDTRTFVSQDDVIRCNYGGNADLSNVFLIKDCRSLFGSVWKRLWGCLRKTGKPASSDAPQVSFLAEVIHTTWLDHNRKRNIANAEDFVKKQSTKETPRRKQKRQDTNPKPGPVGQWPRELTEDELIAGYNGRPVKKARAVF